MSDAEAPNEITISNERAINTLARAIRLSLGQFSLILARCNYIGLRDQMVQQLHQVSSVEIYELRLPISVKTLYTTIRAELGEQQPQALMILGLESVMSIDQVLTSTNQIREEFRKSFAFPLVLWVNDDLLQRLIHLAPDFKSWAATSIKFEPATPSLIQMLQDTADAMFAASLHLGTGRFLDNTSLNSLLGLRQTIEMEFAAKDLQHRELALDSFLEASVQFLRGRSADAMGDRLKARHYYEQSLKFWLHECEQWRKGQKPVSLASLDEKSEMPVNSFCLERRGCLLFYLGLWWRQEAVLHRAEYETACLKARDYYQQCVEGFLQGDRPDLAARFINAWGEVLARLGLQEELDRVAHLAVHLHQQYSDPMRLAFSYGLLGEVALMQQNWVDAQHQAERALSTNNDVVPETREQRWNQEYYRNLYLLLLAQAKQHLDQIPEAIAHLQTAKASSEPQQAPILYIRLLETLRALYFKQGDYLEAFRMKQDQRSVEQQFGLRAFIGAGRLQPTQKVINYFQPAGSSSPGSSSPATATPTLASELLPANHSHNVAQEIVASGRQQDLQRLVERIYRSDRKLSIIYGQSGVGKSSLVRAGLVPALKQITIEARDILPVLLDVYTDWEGMLRRNLSDALLAVRGIEITTTLNDLNAMLMQLRQNTDRNLVTVLIFDQFEEFFFVYRDREKRRIFYQFLSQCLNLPFVKVVFSLREDYLHYLLEFNRLGSLEVINNNILDKEILYYLGNLSPEDAKSVIQNLTERSKVYLEPSLVDKLVQDLAGDAGEVRPIELQIVCAQLETDKITTLEQYQQRGTKKELVARFLQGVIEDCGIENKNAAQLVLYFLTDENGTRPLKTRAELAAELSAEEEKLDLILEILVASGLVFLLPEAPADRYQLVHDYLVNFIRQQQGLGLLEELQELRTKDKLSQAEIEQLRREKQLLAELTEAREKQKKSENRLNLFFRYAFIGSAIGLVLLAFTATTAVLNAQEASRQRAAAVAQQRQTQINQVDALSVSSTALLPEQPLEALLTSVQMGQLLQELDKTAQNSQSIASVPDEIRTRSLAALQQTVTAVQERNRLEGHTAPVFSVSFSPNGQELVSAGKDNTIKIWAADGKLLQSIANAHTQPIRNVVFSPDGKWLASVSDDKTIKLWNAAGKPIRTLAVQSKALNAATFSPNNQQLVTTDAAGTIHIWQVSSGKLLKTLKGHTGAINSIHFNPDGSRLVSAGQDGTVRIWDSKTGAELANLNQHKNAVNSATFSPDGSLIASAGKDGTVRLWSKDGNSLRVLKGQNNEVRDGTNEVRDVSFSPDGKTLASASIDRTIKIWSVEGRLLNTFLGHTDTVYQIAFDPTGTRLASASHDKTVRIWNIPRTPQQSLTGHYNSVSSVSFSPDGKTLVSGSYDRSLRIWSLDGKLLKNLETPSSVIDVYFSPNGQYIASAHVDGAIRLWTATGALITTFYYPTEVYSVRFSPDNKTLIAGGLNGTVKRWGLDGKDLGTIADLGYGNTVFGLAFSPDGQTIAVASRTQGVQLWSLKKKLRDFRGHTDEVNSVAFNPDGSQLVSASRDRTVRVWDVATGRLLNTLEGHTYAVQSAVFSPDGQTIASASDDKTVKIWKAATGMLEKTLEGHTDGVTKVSFTPNGNRLASSSADTTIRLWNTERLNFDQLLDRACSNLRDYLHTNPHFQGKPDRTRCDKPTQ